MITARISRLAGCAAIAASLLLAACATQPPAAEEKKAAETGTAADSDATRVMIAEIALERGDCEQAATNYNAVMKDSKDTRLVARSAAVSLVCGQLGQAGEAIEHWRKLAPRDGEAALADALLALKLYRLDEAREALTVWRDAGGQGGEDPGEFAELLERESDATAALDVYSTVLAGSDPTAEVLLAQAQLALRAFDLEKAIASARRVLELDSDSIDAAGLLVRAQALRGEEQAAIDGARKLQARASGEERFVLADVLAALDRTEEAREELTRLQADPELRAGAERRLGTIALDRGEEAVAERHFTALTDDRGSSPLAIYYLGRIAERRDDSTRALQSYALLVNSPLATMARGRAASILVARGARDQGLALLDEYARANPQDAVDLAGVRADVLAEHGDFDAALADIDAALKRYPSHPSLEYQRAGILERAGRKRESEAAFEKILKTRPQDPGIANALGYTLADHDRDLPRAQKLIQQALSVSPDSPAIQDSQGWVMYRQGKLKEASQVLERAWRNGRDAEIGAHWGEVLWKLGDRAQAHAVWTRALATDPKNEAVRATVARLTGTAPPSRTNSEAR